MPIEMEAHQLVGSTSSSQSNQSQLIGLESQGPRELNPQSSISIWPRWSELRLDANQFHSLLIASTIPSPLIGRQFTSIISNCIQPQLNSVTWHTKLLIIAQPHFARPFLFFFFSFSSSFTSFFSFLFLFSFFFFFLLIPARLHLATIGAVKYLWPDLAWPQLATLNSNTSIMRKRRMEPSIIGIQVNSQFHFVANSPLIFQPKNRLWLLPGLSQNPSSRIQQPQQQPQQQQVTREVARKVEQHHHHHQQVYKKKKEKKKRKVLASFRSTNRKVGQLRSRRN